MKFSDIWNDTEVKPFRLAAVIIAAVLAMTFVQKSNGQSNPVENQSLNWTTSIDEAIEMAREQNSPVMIYFNGSDWCPWSQKLSKEVFETEEFDAWFDSKIVPVFVDFPKTKSLPEYLSKQNNKLLSRYRPHLTGFPTALFVKPNGAVIGKLGYVEGGV